MTLPILAVPVLNRYDLLESMIASIDYPVDDVLVIDNGGALDRFLVNDNIARIRILPMPHNIGVPASWNLAIKCFPHAPYWTICANDLTWSPGALKVLAEASTPNDLTISDRGFSAFSVGANIVRRVGVFDENYVPGYWEDIDFERRVRAAGIFPRYPAAHINLHDSCTTAKSDPRYARAKTRSDVSNERYYTDKFNGAITAIEPRWDLQRHIDNDWTVDD
jgi:GT2 family glycosyltransferase